MFNNIFGKLGQDVNVKQDDLFNMANQASSMDLKDEEQVRALIESVASMVGKELDPSVEEKLTKMILDGDVPKDMNELMKMMI